MEKRGIFIVIGTMRVVHVGCHHCFYKVLTLTFFFCVDPYSVLEEVVVVWAWDAVRLLRLVVQLRPHAKLALQLLLPLPPNRLPRLLCNPAVAVCFPESALPSLKVWPLVLVPPLPTVPLVLRLEP